MEPFWIWTTVPLILLWVCAYELYKIRWLLEAWRKHEGWGLPQR